MMNREIKALLIEDNPGDVRMVRESLMSAANGSIEIEPAGSLASGVERLSRGGIDLVLLDLSLPDSQGFDTIERLHANVPHVPIIALSSFDEPELIHSAVQKGADDYLIKGAFSAELLTRSIHYAIDRSKARAELALARDSALESSRMRAEFLANMSHEIRTPLSGVIGMTRLLAESGLNNDQREMLEIVQLSADSLLRTVNDILDFSKISAGKVVLDETDFDLSSTVESAVALFAGPAHAKGVELASYIAADVPVMLRGDPARLCQVLTNLVGNAVKFTLAGEVAVRVGLVSDNGEVTLRFTITDTGIGIPLDSQRQLFQVFTQANRSTARKYGGTGLGLAISAQLVELMGGNIGVQSEPGGGSTFWFTSNFVKQQTARGLSGDLSTRMNRTRVLVVDCSAVAARITREQMSTWGIESDTVATAGDAIAVLTNAAASANPYEIVLIDMQLPGVDGLTLGRAISENPRFANLRLIGTYVRGKRPDDAQLKAAGIRALLAKPIQQSQLLNTLNAMLSAADRASTDYSEPRNQRRSLREITSRLSKELRARTRMLLVEDNVVNRQVQTRLLELIGYKAEYVTNGLQAIETLKKRDFDVVLMDCQMPLMDGYTATRMIRRNEGDRGHTVVIGVTAHALSGDREVCLEAGMDDYISKPVVPEDLVSILDKWVGALDESVPAQSAPSLDDSNHAYGDTVLDASVLAELRDYAGPDKPDFLLCLLTDFLDDLSRRMGTIRSALSGGDFRSAHESAHALKSSCGELGARRMQAVCERLELCPDDTLLRDREAILRDLENAALDLTRALQAEKTKIQPSA